MDDIPRDKPCPHCGRFANRGVSVDALIVQDGRILLIQRGAEPFKGYWGTPGGYVDWDESAEQAVVREVSEELNVQGRTIRQIGTYSNPERHPKQVINIAFAVEISGEPEAGDDAAACQWFDLDDLPEELAFDHAQIIADYRKQEQATN